MKPFQMISDGIFTSPAEGDDLCRLVAAATDPAGGSEGVALEMTVMKVIDLTKTSHQVDITLERLNEMVAAYDPAVEQASLNFDHAWGGPSLGWAEKIWVEGIYLWARYVDLDPVAVDGLRTKRYKRRSAEVCFRHFSNDGWYFTGCALLGNARPAIDLPPVQFQRPVYRLEDPMSKKTDDPPVLPPAAAPAPEAQPEPLAAAAALVAESREELARLQAEAATLRSERALLSADNAINRLGTRVTPAQVKILQPLLVSLYSEAAPKMLKLQVAGVEQSRTLAEHLLEILLAAPEIEALNPGQLAAHDDPRSTGLAAATGLTAERLAELDRKYQFSNTSLFKS